ncbi:MULTISPECIES: DNA-binding protein [unclassified Streptomyces]|uniref:DNA-binding protein n=1 Tax=unclassified Streptomyces TaxID=2593676 RepID=UPI0036EA537B
MRQSGQRKWSEPRRHRGYVLLKVDTIEDTAWMCQLDAARRLGVSLARLGMLIANGRITPAHNSAGRAGDTIVSVEAEETWRAHATIRAKIARLMKDTINWF